LQLGRTVDCLTIQEVVGDAVADDVEARVREQLALQDVTRTDVGDAPDRPGREQRVGETGVATQDDRIATAHRFDTVELRPEADRRFEGAHQDAGPPLHQSVLRPLVLGPPDAERPERSGHAGHFDPRPTHAEAEQSDQREAAAPSYDVDDHSEREPQGQGCRQDHCSHRQGTDAREPSAPTTTSSSSNSSVSHGRHRSGAIRMHRSPCANMQPGMSMSHETSGPEWWTRHRVGILVTMSADSVPAWAPIGRRADRYRLDLSGSDPDGPLVETLAHHRDRWLHVADPDAFVELLTFDDFDADEWTSLVRDTGVGTLVVTARDRYGLCWFDTSLDQECTGHPDTGHPDVVRVGPRRDVLGQLAAACERDDIVLGAQYWTRPDDPAVQVRHLRLLVDRYGVRRLAGGDDPTGRLPHAPVVGSGPEVVVDDRLVDHPTAIRTFDRCPHHPVDGPWEISIPIGASAAYNRSERDEHLATASRIVAALTEVVAKGGHALLAVGTDAHGRIATAHAERCLAVGGWLRRHRELIERSEPWHRWGDDESRHLLLDGVLHAIDVNGRGRFAALDPEVGRVERIETIDGVPVGFDQDHCGVVLHRPARKERRLPQVYRVTLAAAPAPPARLFDEPASRPVDLAPLVDGATRGAIVQLGEGAHTGLTHVPSGVTVRGLGPDRTVIGVGPDAPVRLMAGARFEHCSVVSTEPSTTAPLVDVRGDGAAIVGCAIHGSLEIHGSHARLVSITTRAIHGEHADHVSVVRSTIVDPVDDGPAGIVVDGGAGHLVDSCLIGTTRIGIRIANAVGTVVRGNRIRASWTGVRVDSCQDTAVLANSFERVARAIDVVGGSDAEVSGNLATTGDSGAVVRDGATACTVAGNRWERTRIGLLAWDVGVVHHRDNDCIDLGDPDGAVVTGP
ncbi:MAG: hypothetical protein RLZZ01_2664, partial [Actinomycetota bacterium]